MRERCRLAYTPVHLPVTHEPLPLAMRSRRASRTLHYEREPLYPTEANLSDILRSTVPSSSGKTVASAMIDGTVSARSRIRRSHAHHGERSIVRIARRASPNSIVEKTGRPRHPAAEDPAVLVQSFRCSEPRGSCARAPAKPHRVTRRAPLTAMILKISWQGIVHDLGRDTPTGTPESPLLHSALSCTCDFGCSPPSRKWK